MKNTKKNSGWGERIDYRIDLKEFVTDGKCSKLQATAEQPRKKIMER